MIKKYFKYKNWYRNTRSQLIKKYGKEYKLFSALLASTSVRRDIKRNYQTSQKIFLSFVKNRKNFLEYAKKNKKEFCKKYGIMTCYYNNVIRSLEFNFNSRKKFTLSGNKINAFYHNLIGQYQYVTIDTWIMKYFKHDKKWLNLTDYKYYSRIIRKLGHKYNLLPSEMQAVIWEYIRSKHGVKALSFADII